MLRHWHPMKSIFPVKGRTYRIQFKCNHLRNWRCFLNFLLPFWNLFLISNVSKKRMNLIAYIFRNYRLQNGCLWKCLKCHVSGHPRRVNIFPKTAVISTILVLSSLLIALGKFLLVRKTVSNWNFFRVMN